MSFNLNPYSLEQSMRRHEIETDRSSREEWKYGEEPCTMEGCGKAVKAKGLCAMHYQRKLRKGDPMAGRASAYRCKTESCSKIPLTRGYCQEHFIQKFGTSPSFR